MKLHPMAYRRIGAALSGAETLRAPSCKADELWSCNGAKKACLGHNKDGQDGVEYETQGPCASCILGDFAAH